MTEKHETENELVKDTTPPTAPVETEAPRKEQPAPPKTRGRRRTAPTPPATGTSELGEALEAATEPGTRVDNAGTTPETEPVEDETPRRRTGETEADYQERKRREARERMRRKRWAARRQQPATRAQPRTEARRTPAADAEPVSEEEGLGASNIDTATIVFGLAVVGILAASWYYSKRGHTDRIAADEGAFPAKKRLADYAPQH